MPKCTGKDQDASNLHKDNKGKVGADSIPQGKAYKFLDQC